MDANTNASTNANNPSKKWQEITPSRDTIQKYLQILTYKIIGDDAMHSKYLHKMALQGNADALEDLKVEQAIADALAHMQNLLEQLSALGYKRIAAVCRSVTENVEGVFPRVIMCTVCCLTGLQVDDSIEVRIDKQFFNVDSKYKQFIYSLWLCRHMRQIENARVASWVCDENVRTISDAIRAYLESDSAPNEQDCRVYANAFCTVMSSLADTLEYVKASEASYLGLARMAENKA